MAQTPEGSKKQAATMKAKYGDNIFAVIGSKGGSTPTTKLKGWAYLKHHDPKRFKELIRKSKDG